MYTTTSDPSDSYSNHWSNVENKEGECCGEQCEWDEELECYVCGYCGNEFND